MEGNFLLVPRLGESPTKKPPASFLEMTEMTEYTNIGYLRLAAELLHVSTKNGAVVVSSPFDTEGTARALRLILDEFACLTAKNKVRLLPALNIPFEALKKAADVIIEACK